MKIEKDKFAAIVSGCNFSQDSADEIVKLVGDCRTVVIKNNTPQSPESIISFYKKLGRVVRQNDKVSGTVATGELVKAGKGALFSGTPDGELEWHSAGMNRVGHDDIVGMYMNKMADTGGNTHFTDHQTAFEDLDEKTKELCRTLKSKIITYNAKVKLEKMHYRMIFSDEQTMFEFRDIDGKKSFEKQIPRKSLVTKHPINGKEGLYFPWIVIRGFAGLSQEEQHNLYYMLKEHTLSEKYVYTHKWDPYDIILSDQHHSTHRRDAYTGDRELWRAGIWIN